MGMTWTYAVELRREEDGSVGAYTEVMPDAIAGGVDETEALREMGKALDAAVRGRIHFGMDLVPPPSDSREASHTVTLSAALAAKATVYVLWRRSGQTKVALAKELAVNEKEARRVLDPDYPTGLDRLEAAALTCGYRLTISATPIDADAPTSRTAA